MNVHCFYYFLKNINIVWKFQFNKKIVVIKTLKINLLIVSEITNLSEPKEMNKNNDSKTGN